MGKMWTSGSVMVKFELPHSVSHWKRKLYSLLHDKLKLPGIVLVAIFSLSLKMWAVIILWFILAPVAYRWDLGPIYEVEKIVQPSYREMENSKGKTPHALFTERHKTLMAEGEKWMKETAKSSMVVAALISTVMFTTAFTVPGGYNNNSGEPIFENQKSFFIFSVADALALFCSSTSILMFHSILTSRSSTSILMFHSILTWYYDH